MTLEDIINNLKTISESLQHVSETKLNELSEKQLEDAKIMPIMTEYSFINPNECYVTAEEFEKLKHGRIFIENGKPVEYVGREKTGTD